MGILYVVATPIGNLNDLSLRAIDVLRKSDVILAEDTRQTIKLLNKFDIKTKMISYHKFNEKKKCGEIIQYLNDGMNVSLVSDAGTPCISDPGYVLVKEARENNIEVVGIPGCSAVITSLSICGLDTSSFAFYGFAPIDNKDREELFYEIKHSKIKTKVLYESPKRVLSLLRDISANMPGCVVCVCAELTKIHERCIYGKIDDVLKRILENSDVIKGEFVVLISNEPEKEEDDAVTLESLIVNEMVKTGCSFKDAIKIISKKNKNVAKRDIYNASLNLKKVLSKNQL